MLAGNRWHTQIGYIEAHWIKRQNSSWLWGTQLGMVQHPASPWHGACRPLPGHLQGLTGGAQEVHQHELLPRGSLARALGCRQYLATWQKEKDLNTSNLIFFLPPALWLLPSLSKSTVSHKAKRPLMPSVWVGLPKGQRRSSEPSLEPYLGGPMSRAF